MAGPKITHWILEGSTRNIVATFPYDIEYERTNGVDLKTILCLDWTGDVNQFCASTDYIIIALLCVNSVASIWLL
jgi:hypothetical protein